MNLANRAGEPDRVLLFAGFNQDNTSVAAGTKDGYQIFNLSHVDRLEQIHSCDAERDICILGRLFSSSLIAKVSVNSPRKLKVCHFKKGTEICSYSYTNSILTVKLNRQRLIVCLEESIYIHNIRDMKVVHTIKETAPNPQGICDLSTAGELSYLAYPGSNQTGTLELFDTLTLKSVASIPAHNNALAALALNQKGTHIATASEKGTVIRVFSVPDGEKLYEFRRGVKRCVTISSLAFDPEGSFLCCSSNTETVHIFKLENRHERQSTDESTSTGLTSYVTSMFTNPTAMSYLPQGVTDVFTQFRAFATCKLEPAGLRTICAITTIQKLTRVIIISDDGLLQIFNLNVEKGGVCDQIKTHRIDGVADENASSHLGAQGDRPLTSPRSTPQIPVSSSRSYQDLPSESGSPAQKRENLRLADSNEFPEINNVQQA